MLSKREKWLMLKAYQYAAAEAHNDTVEGIYDLCMEREVEPFEEWIDDGAADGVTVGDVLSKECPFTKQQETTMPNETIKQQVKEILSDNLESTWVLANKVGLRDKTPKMRKILIGMEAEGVVKRHPHSVKNNIVWMLA